MAEPTLPDLDPWCLLGFPERRDLLARALSAALEGADGLSGVRVEPGPVGREYDMTAVAETDVGRLRTPLWSHARASIYCDGSIHPANRRQVGPDGAVREAADRLRRRLAVPYALESRGLTLTLSPEDGVERTWTAEHSRFRKRTAVTREDRVEKAGDLDVRDLLAHFYTGPSLRLVSAEGEPILLPGSTEAEGPVVTLCHACGRWHEGAHSPCPACGDERVDVVTAARGREG
jgi:hypothetical protein